MCTVEVDALSTCTARTRMELQQAGGGCIVSAGGGCRPSSSAPVVSSMSARYRGGQLGGCTWRAAEGESYAWRPLYSRSRREGGGALGRWRRRGGRRCRCLPMWRFGRERNTAGTLISVAITDGCSLAFFFSRPWCGAVGGARVGRGYSFALLVPLPSLGSVGADAHSRHSSIGLSLGLSLGLGLGLLTQSRDVQPILTLDRSPSAIFRFGFIADSPDSD
ncbi:hypothetical protein B0H19DRAFT_582235 [Mycena capillaripes]|nr:hypothetical protein B0H19DRAFT_582235 [Mycena capillaripes]